MVDLGPFFFDASTTINEWIYNGNWPKKYNSVSLEKRIFVFCTFRLTNSYLAGALLVGHHPNVLAENMRMKGFYLLFYV